jgi:hypothetical protein
MVKIFQVSIRDKKVCNYPFGGSLTMTSNYYPSGITDNSITNNLPIMVVAHSILQVAKKYPNADMIVELESKEVVIMDSVKIVCPVKHDE